MYLFHVSLWVNADRVDVKQTRVPSPVLRLFDAKSSVCEVTRHLHVLLVSVQHVNVVLFCIFSFDIQNT